LPRGRILARPRDRRTPRAPLDADVRRIHRATGGRSPDGSEPVTEAGTVGPVRTYRWTIVTAVIGVVLLVLVLVTLFI